MRSFLKTAGTVATLVVLSNPVTVQASEDDQRYCAEYYIYDDNQCTSGGSSAYYETWSGCEKMIYADPNEIRYRKTHVTKCDGTDFQAENRFYEGTGAEKCTSSSEVQFMRVRLDGYCAEYNKSKAYSCQKGGCDGAEKRYVGGIGMIVVGVVSGLVSGIGWVLM